MSEIEKAFSEKAEEIKKRADERIASIIRKDKRDWNALIWKLVIVAAVILLAGLGAAFAFWMMAMKILELV